MKHGKKCVPALTLVAALATQAAWPAITVYDAADDFSDAINPNGTWTYLGSQGQVLTTNQSDWDPTEILITSQPAWADSTFPNPAHVPMWFRYAGFDTQLDVPGVGMHGAEGGTVAWVGIRWVSPIDGEIDIQGGVWQALKVVNDGVGGNHQVRNSDWQLRLNATVLASGNVSGTDAFTSAMPFSLVDGAATGDLTGIPVGFGDEVVLEFISPTTFATFNGIELTIAADDAPGEVELCGGLAPTIVGTEAADVIIGTSGSDVILGMGGNDLIEGRGGDDVVCGGSGDDAIAGNAGNDMLFGEAGRDSLRGGSGIDDLRGGAGIDVLLGGGGEDTLRGNGGGDRLYGDGGNDDLRGGGGDDILVGGGGGDSLDGGMGTDICDDSGVIVNCETP